MKAVPLTKGLFGVVDDRDYEWAMQYKWFCTFSLKNKTKKGYAARSKVIDGKKGLIWLHKEVLTRWHGPHPIGQHIGDHLDGDSLNCRLGNLRWASFQDNARNKFGFLSRQLDLFGHYGTGELIWEHSAIT